uniref:Orphan peptide AbOp-24 n=2 Tax=Androctonus bicolor TaxID=748906 RepID=A0A0K0LC48_9SCOR|nr:orphan peptide AbOp-24 [Androctonus bicolor]AIX87726.1 orphan peptide AbOp-24 [Androctonus bicolor]
MNKSLIILIVAIVVLSLWSEADARERRCQVYCSNSPRRCQVRCSWSFGKREIFDSVEDVPGKLDDEDEAILKKLAIEDLKDE